MTLSCSAPPAQPLALVLVRLVHLVLRVQVRREVVGQQEPVVADLRGEEKERQKKSVFIAA